MGKRNLGNRPRQKGGWEEQGGRELMKEGVMAKLVVLGWAMYRRGAVWKRREKE